MASTFPTDTAERTVLVHLNLVIEADSDEAAEQAARAYLRAHNVPLDDIADVEVL